MNARRLFAIVMVVLFSTSFAYAQLTTSQIVKKYSPSVVTIVALDANDQPISLGSGFFINANGDIATNHHVLEGSAKAIIKTSEDKKGEVVEIINDDTELDLLIAKTSLKTNNPLPLGDSDTITVGEEIIAIGNPAGLEGTVSNGIISGIRKVEGFKFIQITAPISPGSSGGPVFNSTGKVIGIATAYLDVGQNLNFAMPVNYLKSLKSNRIKLSSLPKVMPKAGAIETDNTLVKTFDLHYHLLGNALDFIEFGIKNLGSYPIRNIKLLFVYKTCEQNECTTGEIISYSVTEIKDVILPKLALQFSHRHRVNYFVRNITVKFKSGEEIEHPRMGEVEIRILDYKIDRTSRASPVDLLFK